MSKASRQNWKILFYKSSLVDVDYAYLRFQTTEHILVSMTVSLVPRLYACTITVIKCFAGQKT